MTSLLSDVMTELYRETLGNIYDTVVEDKDSALTFSDLAQAVKDLKAEKKTGDRLLLELRGKLEIYTIEIEAANNLIELYWRKIAGEKNLLDQLIDADVAYIEARATRKKIA